MNTAAMQNTYQKYRSDFLFGKFSFSESFFSIFNLFGKNFKINDSKSEEEADAKALQNDFGMVGYDIAEAIKKFNQELKIHD